MPTCAGMALLDRHLVAGRSHQHQAPVSCVAGGAQEVSAFMTHLAVSTRGNAGPYQVSSPPRGGLGAAQAGRPFLQAWLPDALDLKTPRAGRAWG